LASDAGRIGAAANESLEIPTVVTSFHMNHGIYYAIALLTLGPVPRWPRTRCYLTLGLAETRTTPDRYAGLYNAVVRVRPISFLSLQARVCQGPSGFTRSRPTIKV
jgi:hypothetical protein